MSGNDEAHDVSIGKYMVGFILAVLLTLASFIPVMMHMMDDWSAALKVTYLVGLALIQIFVQIIFFLHLDSGPDAKWNIAGLLIGIFSVFIIIVGTWWAVQHINNNTSGVGGRIVQPEMIPLPSSSAQPAAAE